MPAGAVKENVDGGSFEMAAFDQHGARPIRVNPACGFAHVFPGIHFEASQGARLVQIRRNQKSPGQEMLPERARRPGVKQRRAVLADHDGIDDHRKGESGSRIGNSGHYRRVAQCANLCCFRGNVGNHCLELLANELGIKTINARDAHRVLHRNQRDYRFAVHSELMEGLQVSLDAGAARGV